MAMDLNLEEVWPLWMVTGIGAKHGPCSVSVWMCGVAPFYVFVTEKASPPWSDGTFGTISDSPEGAVILLQVERRCREAGYTSNMNTLSFADESPREREVEWWRVADGALRGGAESLSAGILLTG